MTWAAKKREEKGGRGPESKGRTSRVFCFGFGFLSAAPHSTWDLVPMPSALEMWSLTHRTTREVSWGSKRVREKIVGKKASPSAPEMTLPQDNVLGPPGTPGPSKG